MNIQSEWWPVATSKELTKSSKKGKPLSRKLDSVPFVVFRDHNGVAAALPDYCPHRLMPLSAGRVCNGEMQCAYHGWQFKSDGYCSHVPGITLPAQTKPLLPTVGCQEIDGLIWVSLLPQEGKQPALAKWNGPTLDSFFMHSIVQTTIDQGAENFLDAFHTHFVHAGWIRRDSRRQSLRVTISKLPDGIEARYDGEGKQSGLISKIFESDRAWSAGRFVYPGLAEIEYQGARGLTLLASVWLVPEGKSQLRVVAKISTPKNILPGWVKRAVLQPFFQVTLNQDKAALELQHVNRELYAEKSFLDSPIDFLGPSIRRLLSGEPVDPSVERQIIVQL